MMSMCYVQDPQERKRMEHEEDMYFRIMREGKISMDGYLIEPPSDMTSEESAYYQRLLKENGGKIRFVV